MGNYSLSTRAQYDIVGIYKYGVKFFGVNQAVIYLTELEDFLEELAERSGLAKDASSIANSLKYYNHKSHVIYYMFDKKNDIYIVRILGKRMDFRKHL